MHLALLTKPNTGRCSYCHKFVLLMMYETNKVYFVFFGR